MSTASKWNVQPWSLRLGSPELLGEPPVVGPRGLCLPPQAGGMLPPPSSRLMDCLATYEVEAIERSLDGQGRPLPPRPVVLTTGKLNLLPRLDRLLPSTPARDDQLASCLDRCPKQSTLEREEER